MQRFSSGVVYALGAVVGTMVASSAMAQSANNFYQGKTIRIVVALGTGGDYDNYARLAGRWLNKQIPGNPSIIVQNMPGGGGVTAANHVYNVAAKDGTTLGALHANTTLAQITGAPNIEFDVRKLGWIGRTSSGGLNVQHSWHTSKVKTFDDLLNQQSVVGSGGPTSDSTVLPTVINQMMGGKMKILGGYAGTAETTLALERGEVDVAMQNWEFIRARQQDWLRDKKIHMLVQYGVERHPELPDVPAIMELAKSQEVKDVWTVFLGGSQIGYSLVTTPGVPADRVQLLRTAFTAMTKDDGIKADADKMNLPIEPLTGAQVQEIVDGTFNVNPKSIEAAKKVLGR